MEQVAKFKAESYYIVIGDFDAIPFHTKKCYSHMRINCELIMTADVKGHFVCKTYCSCVEHGVNNVRYCGGCCCHKGLKFMAELP